MKKYFIGLGIALVLIIGYLSLDRLLFTGVESAFIKEASFQANFHAKPEVKNKTTLILIGGGEWGDYWGQYVAQKDFVGLSLPYFGYADLPKLPEEIDIAYFERAISWLIKQPEVNPNKIVVMGASRNAELALVLAAYLNKSIQGVIAYAPSSVSWSNTVLPFNSDSIKPSWMYKGKPIPYIPMKKLKGNEFNQLNHLAYWKEGLEKTEVASQAGIPVEKINGPILLFSGKDDQVWPSSVMANSIAYRLKENGFQYQFQNIQYDQAGHLIGTNPDSRSGMRIGRMNIDGVDYEYSFGGSLEGDFKAKQDARKKLIQFLVGL